MRWLTLLGVFAAGCAGVPSIQYPYDAPPGSLRLGVVSWVAPRSAVLERRDLMEPLGSAGIPEQDIQDGSVIQMMIHCCDGPTTGSYSFAFAPPGVRPQVGDIVEVRMVHDREADGPARLNVVTRIREPYDTHPSHCAWMPDEKGLWLRAVYCDWMPAEGWTGIRNMYGQTIAWVKAAD